MLDLSHPHILLVEDSRSDALLIESELQEATMGACRITKVERLAEAVDHLAAEQFDVLLLDLSLPDSQGMDTVQRVHTVAPHVAILVLTGMDDENVGIEALRIGAQDYLVKGDYDGRGLLRAIRYAVERKQVQEELRRAHDELEVRVTERTQELARVNRGLRVLSESNQILVRSTSEEMLLQRICQAIVEFGDYPLACVVLCDCSTDSPHPARAFYTADLVLSNALRASPALRESIYAPCRSSLDLCEGVRRNRSHSDADSEPLLPFQSVIALPLQSGDETLGALAIYASQADCFDAPEQEILSKFAEDFAFGLASIRAHSERRKAEASLQKSNELLEQMFSTIYLQVAYLDRAFNFVRVNENYARSVGYTSDVLVGMNYFALFPHSRECDIFRKVVETGEPYVVYEKPTDASVGTHGEIKYLDWTLHPVRGPKGEVTGVILTILDATERVRMARTLWEVERRFHVVFDQAFQLIALLHPDGIPVQMNRTFLNLTGYPVDQVESRLLWDAPFWTSDPESRTRAREAVAAAAQGELARYETQLLVPNGQVMEIDVSVKPMYDLYGKVSFLLWEARDISERKQAQRTLEDLYLRVVDVHEVERRRLARELHDGVNQILSSAKFRLQAVEKRIPPDSEDIVRDLHSGWQLLETAIQEVRRMSHNLRPSVLDDLGLIPALRGTLSEFREKTRIATQFDCSDIPDSIDPNIELTLFRVTQEVLTNIEKHAKASNISILLSLRDGVIHFVIADDGKGFEANPKGQPSGTNGLGLLHIRERVAFVGGNCVVESWPGQGTQVAIQIPWRPDTREEIFSHVEAES